MLCRWALIGTTIMSWAVIAAGAIAGWPSTGYFWACLAYAMALTVLSVMEARQS